MTFKTTFSSSYIFRSGNVEHVSDKFYNTLVEVLPANASRHFIAVDSFDEFGLAEGDLKRSFGPLLAIRIRVTKVSYYWTVLSEVSPNTSIDSHFISTMSIYEQGVSL